MLFGLGLFDFDGRMEDMNVKSEDRSTVVSLGEALVYQDKSVISRVMLKNAGGTITLFAFDAGEGLSEHKAQQAKAMARFTIWMTTA